LVLKGRGASPAASALCSAPRRGHGASAFVEVKVVRPRRPSQMSVCGRSTLTSPRRRRVEQRPRTARPLWACIT